MNIEQLFNRVTEEIAFPHKTITKGDFRRAARIFELIGEFADNEEIMAKAAEFQRELYLQEHPEERELKINFAAFAV